MYVINYVLFVSLGYTKGPLKIYTEKVSLP